MKFAPFLTATVLSIASTTAALALQDGTFPPTEPPRGRGEGAPGERPRPPIDPAQAIERLMQNDANGDGLLSKDELPPPLADRLMERADTNKDGLLDRAELEAAVQAGALGRGGGAGRGSEGRGSEGRGSEGRETERRGGAGAPGSSQSVEGAMQQLNRSFRRLKSSAFDDASRRSDLDSIQTVQSAMIAAKSGTANMRMSDAAKARFGDDRAKLDAEFRTMMLDSLVIAIDLERAVLAGDGAKAKSLLEKLQSEQKKGHDLFQPAEREEMGERDGTTTDQPQQRPRGGRGRPGGEGPGGSPRGPGGAPEGPRGAPEGPRGAPEGPRGAPEGPRGGA